MKKESTNHFQKKKISRSCKNRIVRRFSSTGSSRIYLQHMSRKLEPLSTLREPKMNFRLPDVDACCTTAWASCPRGWSGLVDGFGKAEEPEDSWTGTT